MIGHSYKETMKSLISAKVRVLFCQQIPMILKISERDKNLKTTKKGFPLIYVSVH